MSSRPQGAAAAGRRGARPAHRDGERSTRDQILGAARDCFGERGHDRATIRGIAARASVDPALVLHYFGSKEQLFAAALEIPLDPGAIIRRVMAHDRGEMGASLVRAFLEAWEPEETRSPLLAMVRSAMTNETAMDLVREFLGRRIFTPLTATLGAADADLRATLIGSQLIGLAMVRYIARIEPMASAPAERIVAAAAPTVQRYLTGDLVAESTGRR
ncbi:MAG TPA: TetR family transcriptional regulator [Thermoleophilia bacterium]|nr:TetR family transcriptional regulator [Thermoleophilia bacterium]